MELLRDITTGALLILAACSGFYAGYWRGRREEVELWAHRIGKLEDALKASAPPQEKPPTKETR